MDISRGFWSIFLNEKAPRPIKMGCIKNSFQKKCWAIFTKQFFLSRKIWQILLRNSISEGSQIPNFLTCMCTTMYWCMNIWKINQEPGRFNLWMQERFLRRQNLTHLKLMVCKLFVKLEEIMNLLIYDFLGLEQISDNKRRSLCLWIWDDLKD